MNSKAVQGVGPGNWTYGADVNLYVSPSGSDTGGNGTQGNPYKTITRTLQDLPVFVSQHYVIYLAAGTYYEQVDITGRYFGTDVLTSFRKTAIEIYGDPAAPDSYVISGATAANPTTPLRDYCLRNSYGNLVLQGVSLQYAKVAGYYQRGGGAAFNKVTLRHHATTDAWAVQVWNGIAALMDEITISDCANGIDADMGAQVSQLNEPLNSGFNLGKLTATGITGVALQAADFANVTAGDSGNSSLTGTGAGGSIGIHSWFGGRIWWDGGPVSNFETCVESFQTSIVASYDLICQNATTGIRAHGDGHFVSGEGPQPEDTFVNVTTPFSAAWGGTISTSSATYSDGGWTSLGAVNVKAGGTNQNVTLIPSGTGSVQIPNTSGAELSFTGTGNNTNITSDADIYLFAGTGKMVHVGANGTNWILNLDTSGNVGIGTLSPGQRLEINGGVRLNTADTKPTCNAGARGTFWVTRGGTGVKDSVEVCAKDAGDAYAWRALY